MLFFIAFEAVTLLICKCVSLNMIIDTNSSCIRFFRTCIGILSSLVHTFSLLE